MSRIRSFIGPFQNLALIGGRALINWKRRIAQSSAQIGDFWRACAYVKEFAAVSPVLNSKPLFGSYLKVVTDWISQESEIKSQEPPADQLTRDTGKNWAMREVRPSPSKETDFPPSKQSHRSDVSDLFQLESQASLKLLSSLAGQDAKTMSLSQTLRKQTGQPSYMKGTGQSLRSPKKDFHKSRKSHIPPVFKDPESSKNWLQGLARQARLSMYRNSIDLFGEFDVPGVDQMTSTSRELPWLVKQWETTLNGQSAPPEMLGDPEMDKSTGSISEIHQGSESNHTPGTPLPGISEGESMKNSPGMLPPGSKPRLTHQEGLQYPNRDLLRKKGLNLSDYVRGDSAKTSSTASICVSSLLDQLKLPLNGPSATSQLLNNLAKDNSEDSVSAADHSSISKHPWEAESPELSESESLKDDNGHNLSRRINRSLAAGPTRLPDTVPSPGNRLKSSVNRLSEISEMLTDLSTNNGKDSVRETEQELTGLRKQDVSDEAGLPAQSAGLLSEISGLSPWSSKGADMMPYSVGGSIIRQYGMRQNSALDKDDLSKLADKLKRILEEEARRHGIDV